MSEPSPPAWPPRVGVIGAGAMGIGVVGSLCRERIPTVVRDIAPDAERESAKRGASIASSPAELARACELVIILVVDAAQVDDVLFGDEGAAAALPSGAVVVVSSTVAPDYIETLATRLAVHGVALIDAPVSGGPRRAADASMSMMVGGAREIVGRCMPVFERIAGTVFAVGAVGNGAKFKIVNNLLAAVNLAAGAEAYALAAKAGLDPAAFVEIVSASSGASWIFGDRMPRVLNDDYAPRAAARVLAKDVGIAVDMAAKLGVTAPFGAAAQAAFAAALQAGYGEEDDAAIVKAALQRNGLA